MTHIASTIERIVAKTWKNDKGEWKPQFTTKKWEAANALVQKMGVSFPRARDIVFVVRADIDFLGATPPDSGEFCSLNVSIFPSSRFLAKLEQLAVSQRAAESQDLQDFLHAEIMSLRDLVEGWVKGYEAAVG